VNSGQRIAIIVGAVVVLAVGFVLVQGSDDEGGREAELAPTETIAQDEAENTETSEGTGGEEAPPADERVVRIRDGKPASGDAETLTYTSGDTVRLRFESVSGAVEVHVHGYDEEVAVPDGGSRLLEFEADAQGIFEVEDHGTDTLLAKLEVRP
jgi:hypothetical protein